MKLWKKFSVLAAVVLLMVTWRPAWAILVNALYDFVQISAPSNPPSGQSRLFVSSSTHQLSCLNSDGSSCAPSGGGGGFIQPLTAPVAANFTQVNFNTGTSVVTTQVNNSSPVTSINLTQNDPNATLEIAGLTKAKLNALFTVTVGCTMNFSQTSAGPDVAGLWLTDGTAHNILFGLDSGIGNGFDANHYSDFAGTFADAILSTGAPSGPLVWLRIQETSTARLFSSSSDGINFQQLTSTSNTAFFTTTQYGFASENRSPAGGLANTTCYSFTETTP